ncbi:hypothetical protein ASPWEDRAFT_341487 [Aspergillus wentii DTO 134E9]|uniref:Uncharacterized protein n=1 Tax=Aspergillus wentii DTO 134E9 TaxID=1073089 RepID=A0A1L9RUZ2_ASPWE|nr:uncharacterized protein ASPWEDRAFT_341487 [Aspergillus wentii DTO 134E9]OJJ38735.1 hypothetical protein ASPWEDRAFT_341487 [Aspergillus wentii DTO 134E9]
MIDFPRLFACIQKRKRHGGFEDSAFGYLKDCRFDPPRSVNCAGSHIGNIWLWNLRLIQQENLVCVESSKAHISKDYFNHQFKLSNTALNFYKTFSSLITAPALLMDLCRQKAITTGCNSLCHDDSSISIKICLGAAPPFFHSRLSHSPLFLVDLPSHLTSLSPSIP